MRTKQKIAGRKYSHSAFYSCYFGFFLTIQENLYICATCWLLLMFTIDTFWNFHDFPLLFLFVLFFSYVQVKGNAHLQAITLCLFMYFDIIIVRANSCLLLHLSFITRPSKMLNGWKRWWHRIGSDFFFLCTF